MVAATRSRSGRRGRRTTRTSSPASRAASASATSLWRTSTSRGHASMARVAVRIAAARRSATSTTSDGARSRMSDARTESPAVTSTTPGRAAGSSRKAAGNGTTSACHMSTPAAARRTSGVTKAVADTEAPSPGPPPLGRQQCLYFFPEPQGHGSFRPTSLMGSPRPGFRADSSSPYAARPDATTARPAPRRASPRGRRRRRHGITTAAPGGIRPRGGASDAVPRRTGAWPAR